MGKNLYASSSQPNIISPSSCFKPKLNDQDYMELVCENGQICAKSPIPNTNGSFQKQRTQSILDLYETEYDESFKKNIKNINGDTQVVPVSESQQPQQGHEANHEQTHTYNINNNNKKKKKKEIKSSKIESERGVLQSKKRIDGSLKGLKNVEVITAPPDEQSAVAGRSTELYFAPNSSSMFSLGTSRDLSYSSSSKRSKCGDTEEEEEESSYLSNNSDDDESDDVRARGPAGTRKNTTKRKRSTEVHKLSERKRRNEISNKMRALQDLLPNCYKDDKVSLLDEAIKYMRTLQLQVQMMSMGINGIIGASAMLPMGHYSPMGLGMHMGTQYQLPKSNVQETGFSGTNDDASSQMLSFLNHLNTCTGLIPNSSPIFSPFDSYSHHQFLVPSCVPLTQTTSFPQFPKSASSTSNFDDAMQFRGINGYYASLN